MKVKDIIQDSSKYFLIKIIRILPPFFMLPILTNYLLPEEYGKFTLILLIVNLFVPIIGLSSHAFLKINYFNTTSDYKSQYGTAISSALALSVILSLVLYLFRELFTEFTAIENIFIPLIVVLIFTRIIHLINQSHYQVTKQFFLYGFSETSVSIIYLTIGIIFIKVFNYSWYYLIYIQIGAYFLINTINLIKLKSNKIFDYSFNYQIQKNIFRYGLPLIPHSVSIYLYNSIDRFFINHFIGIKETGIYSVSIQLGLAISIIFVSFNTAFVPYLFKQLSEDVKKTAKVFKIIFLSLLLASLVSVVFYLTFPLFENLLIDEKYHKASDYLPWIIITQFFMGSQMIFGSFMFYFQKTKTIALLSFTALVLNFFLTYLLVPKLGEIGAALSSTISSLAYLSLTVIFSIKELNKSQYYAI
jgi:O-antigen/teichoic acid export membrane protein